MQDEYVAIELGRENRRYACIELIEWIWEVR